MKAVLFPADRTGALAFQGRLDAAYGCPIEGVDIGGGVHAPPEQSRTTHYGSVMQHPTVLTNYAAVCEGFDAQRLASADRTAVLAALDLTADWFPTPSLSITAVRNP